MRLKTTIFFILLAGIAFDLTAAQEIPAEEVLPRDFNGILNFLLPAILGQITVLLSDAKKYMGSGIWSWTFFWESKIKPFLILTGVTLAVLLVIIYAPFAQPFLEVFTGPIGAITAFSIFAAAQAVLDGIMKPTIKTE